MRRLLFPMTAALVAGCSLLGTTDYGSERFEREQTETWPVRLISRVKVRNVNGNVSVSAVAGDTATAKITRYCTGKDKADAEAHIDLVLVSVEVADGVLTVQVQVPEDDPRTFGADIEIAVPEGTVTDLESVNGNIGVEGIGAAMEFETTNGNITTRGVAGNITAGSTNGQLDIDMAALLAFYRVRLLRQTATRR
ncbi:MAG: hypothetical protein JSU73_06795 [candidate division WOR-3 bacterium]|nr:MAG: hypothetical protein JSU73_06795 [candidate division WOR-3 bacterium]